MLTAIPSPTLTAQTMTQGPNGRSHASHSLTVGSFVLGVFTEIEQRTPIATICTGYQPHTYETKRDELPDQSQGPT